MPKKRRKVRKQKAEAGKSARPAAKAKLAKPKATPPAQPASSPAPADHQPSNEYAYVGREVRQIVSITVFFVVLQIALWFVLRTGLGDKLAGLVAV